VKKEKTGNVKLPVGYLLVSYCTVSTPCKERALSNFEVFYCTAPKKSLIGCLDPNHQQMFTAEEL